MLRVSGIRCFRSVLILTGAQDDRIKERSLAVIPSRPEESARSGSGENAQGGDNLLWTYREVLYFLAWRDVKVRYKRTVLGLPERSCSRC